jgi:type II secretory ATPase GspE/PulE/Tfp pilus assembly ATPase PilB-like protein
MILANTPATEIRASAVSSGMKSMYMDACSKAMAGLTTLEEVARVIAAEEE